MARQLLESSPVQFKPEVLKEDLTEDVQISGGETVKPLMRVRGLFQRYDEKNANNRVYPKELFDRCLNEESWKTRISENSVVGMLEHPEDGQNRLTGPISHIVTKAYDKGNGEIWGECTILNTPDGRKVGALLEAGVPVGISSRGEGEVEECMNEGVQRVIPESFTLVSWDFVSDNSVPGARVKPISAESAREKVSTKSTKKEAIDIPAAKEYLKPTPSMSTKSLIGEMRKAGRQVSTLTSTNLKKLDFNAKVGLVSELDEMRETISTYMTEDKAVTAYGTKLLKEMDDFQAGFESEVPEDNDGGANAPVGLEDAGNGGEENGGAKVDQGAFDEVLKAVLKGMNPECEGADLSGAYQEFCSTGKVDVHGLISKCAGGEEGGDSFDGDAEIGGGEEEEGFGDEDFEDKNAFESRELRAAVELIAHLRESAQNGERYRTFADELKERIRVHHPLLKELEEARKKLATMEGSKEWEARVERNKALLSRAKSEIDLLQKALAEEKQVSEALTALLKEHKVTNAAKLLEKDSEWFKKFLAKKKGEKKGEKKDSKKEEESEETDESIEEDLTGTDGKKGSKSGTGAIGSGDCEMAGPGDGSKAADPDETLEDGEGESATKVGGPDQKLKDQGSKGKDVGPGDCNVVTGPGTTSHKSVSKGESKVTESKEEEHDLLRILTRHRSGSFSQL